MNIKAREDAIFALYNGHCKDCSTAKALPDGCPDPSRYLAADFRAMFVLKEAYGWETETDYPRDLRQFARDGGAFKTWSDLARWCGLMSDPTFDASSLNANDSDERAEKLLSCCFVNLKKIPGKSSSNPSEIAGFATSHSELLKSQIALYRPHVTITCGTFGALRDIYGATQQDKRSVKDGFVYFKNAELGTVIDFYHTQYIKYSPADYLQMLRSNLSYHFPERYT